MRIAIIKVQ